MELEFEVEATRRKLQELERKLDEQRRGTAPLEEVEKDLMSGKREGGCVPQHFVSAAGSLGKADVERFSRQMMVEGIGAAGMERIRRGRVLLVGAGGLGSTIAMFLAAAGVGELDIVDFDVVELSNLHRQVIHTTTRVGWRKVDSAAQACRAINPDIVVRGIFLAFDPMNAESLMQHCDVVVDGTDNVAARYLINDAAVRQRKPVVSGSAMRWDGQLSVYAHKGGPCLRCIFPVPPPHEAVGSCNDTGVMGPMPGCIGCLQAMEVLKILADAGEVLSGRMLIFDGFRFQTRVVNLRGRQKTCPACGDSADTERTLQELTKERPEYIRVSCTSGLAMSEQMLPKEARISSKEFYACLQEPKDSVTSHIILDVRPREQFDMAHLPGAFSLPLSQLEKWQESGKLWSEWERFAGECCFSGTGGCVDVYVLCRRGVSSTKAVKILLSQQSQHDESCCVGTTDVNNEGKLLVRKKFRFINVEGGLNHYHHEADSNFPFY